MNIGLTRLANTNIQDKLPSSFINKQGQPLVCLATLTKQIIDSTDPNMDGSKYAALNSSYLGGDLAFTKYGSLMSALNWNNNSMYCYWISPFDPNYNGNLMFPKTIGCQSTDVINGTANGYVYNPISNYPSNSNSALDGTIFVSPQNGQFILSVSQDSSNNNVYQIFFNPLQDPSLKPTDIQANLTNYCNIVNNSDPMCFCDTTQQICTDSALGGSNNSKALQAKNSTYYNEVQTNCNCLNFQCPYAANNQPNQYAQSFQKGCMKTSACGVNYKYSSTSGLLPITNTQGPWGSVATQCGLAPPPSPTTDGGSVSGGGMKMSTKIIIAVIIIAVVLLIAYYM